VALVLMAGASMVMAPPAHAVFHLMKIREVFAGTADQPAAQFVELQMYSAGQAFVSGHDVKIFDASGEVVGTFTFTQSMSNSEDNAYILVATPEAETMFGVTADLAMTPVITLSGGKACFADTIDCVSWGSYSGDKEGTGTPFNAPTGLVPGQSMERKIAGGDEPDTLDAADDTDDSAADFEAASPHPTSNAGEGQPSGGERTEHARSVTLTLKRHLVAKGQVTTEDGTSACTAGVHVAIQYRTNGKWDMGQAQTTTDEEGNYKVKVQDRPGRYRALLAQEEPNETDRCLQAASPIKRHRHRQ
jgi:hypothetical protein